jgi:arylsulfatase A-like enzyme
VKRPNLLLVFSDQHRGQAVGYAGHPDVRTPHLDALARSGAVFDKAVSNLPVCTPARACLLTGQYPLTHGLIVNDVPLGNTGVHFAQSLSEAGYLTGYIGKWHLAGGPWDAPIPPADRKGFALWRTCECTHDYWRSGYHDEHGRGHTWDGYDVFAQTREAISLLDQHAARGDRPVALFLSFGPPHDPYHPAPRPYAQAYDPDRLSLRPNVPDESADSTRRDLAGYYAHISAIDEAVGRLLTHLDKAGLREDTLVVYTSDHGDMLGSHGQRTKEKPWDESIRIPMVISWPDGELDGRFDRPIGIVDLMPTVLDLLDVPVPPSVEGTSYAALLRDPQADVPDGALIECIQPFGSWGKIYGGREYRGLRTTCHTYVRDRQGPWLLYDNHADPYQLNNLVDSPQAADLQSRLDKLLLARLADRGDAFEPGEAHMERLGYPRDKTGRVPIPPPLGGDHQGEHTR